jgi:hypothetical protein
MPRPSMTIETIYRNAGTTGLQVKICLSARSRKEKYIQLASQSARLASLIDIPNRYARIAVLLVGRHERDQGS